MSGQNETGLARSREAKNKAGIERPWRLVSLPKSAAVLALASLKAAQAAD